MDLGFKSLEAPVIGGIKGIGRAITHALMAKGAIVAFGARHAASLT